MWAVAAAAVLALIAGGSWWMLRSPQAIDAPLVATTIDLRPFAVMRGDMQVPRAPEVAIPRGRLAATILLPLGAEAGRYEVRLLDRALAVQAVANGDGETRESTTAVQALLDTAKLPAGLYQLEVRRVDREWRSFQIRLR